MSQQQPYTRWLGFLNLVPFRKGIVENFLTAVRFVSVVSLKMGLSGQEATEAISLPDYRRGGKEVESYRPSNCLPPSPLQFIFCVCGCNLRL